MVDQQVRGEVEKTLGRLEDMDAASRQRLEKMVAAITGKLVYPPLHFLKTENHCIALPDRIKAIRELYLMDNGGDQQDQE
jgi:glutamyl-tRNA reductase